MADIDLTKKQWNMFWILFLTVVNVVLVLTMLFSSDRGPEHVVLLFITTAAARGEDRHREIMNKLGWDNGKEKTNDN